jgi:hypothetical protein
MSSLLVQQETGGGGGGGGDVFAPICCQRDCGNILSVGRAYRKKADKPSNRPALIPVVGEEAEGTSIMGNYDLPQPKRVNKVLPISLPIYRYTCASSTIKFEKIEK